MNHSNRKTKMKMTLNSLAWVLVLAGFGTTSVWAQVQSDAMPSMDHSMMNHDSMQGQGGPAPVDARDPHAYSGGYTLETGPYALPGTRQLRMADEHNFGSILFNRLERGYGRNNSSSTIYDTQLWFGRDYDRLVIKAEGDMDRGKVQEARTEVLWGHAVAPFWDAQAGLRYDSGGIEPERKWLTLGVQGISPYWFEVDAAAYVGESGRTALRLGAEYEILFTQKLILQPRVEVNFYSQDDTAREIGSGLANGTAGLRLRYEINRQFAPYVGVEGSGKFGKTADLARNSGANTSDTRWVAGVRFWY
jgi:copper resistance protein B